MKSAPETPYWRHILIVALALVTAAIHISLLFPDVIFILNGLGYITLAVLFILPAFQAWRRWVRLAFIGYTAITILAWIAIGERSLLGYMTKVVELVLIALLATETS